MVEDELNAAIVRLVKERSESKKKRASIESELRAAGRALFSIGNSLREVVADGSWNHTPSAILPEIEKAPDICSLAKIRELLEELKKTEDLIKELDKSARDMGID
jgi:prefoldin subunit 5